MKSNVKDTAFIFHFQGKLGKMVEVIQTTYKSNQELLSLQDTVAEDMDQRLVNNTKNISSLTCVLFWTIQLHR